MCCAELFPSTSMQVSCSALSLVCSSVIAVQDVGLCQFALLFSAHVLPSLSSSPQVHWSVWPWSSKRLQTTSSRSWQKGRGHSPTFCESCAWQKQTSFSGLLLNQVNSALLDILSDNPLITGNIDLSVWRCQHLLSTFCSQKLRNFMSDKWLLLLLWLTLLALHTFLHCHLYVTCRARHSQAYLSISSCLVEGSFDGCGVFVGSASTLFTSPNSEHASPPRIALCGCVSSGFTRQGCNATWRQMGSTKSDQHSLCGLQLNGTWQQLKNGHR